jgi:hypothetical protein
MMPDAMTTTAAADAEDTLVPLLRDQRVPWETLHERYGSLLELVRTLIGVVPNCDPYLEIWPPAFRTYNIMVPNFLNLPVSLFGGGAGTLGLGMYVASRVAECPYCSAHTCSFALRRGAPVEKVARALVGGGGSFTPEELATIAVARSLAKIPCELTVAERDELVRRSGADRAEWIVLGIVMMGFLNKFMDAVGVELEASTVAEVAGVLGGGWGTGKAGRELDPSAPQGPPPRADTLWTKLRVLPRIPSAVRLDLRWQQGVPGSWPAVGEHLRERTGHDFPVLSRLAHGRPARAIASMLRENLDPATTVVGLGAKVLAGVVFAAVVEDAALAADVRALAPRSSVTGAELDAVRAFAISAGAAPPGADAARRAVLLLARAASPSPAAITPEVVAACRAGSLPAAGIVEVVSWLSVLQMLHRLQSFYSE